MAIDTRQKRASVPGAGRPWIRGKLPGTLDGGWRAASGMSYAGAVLSAGLIGIILVSRAARRLFAWTAPERGSKWTGGPRKEKWTASERE